MSKQRAFLFLAAMGLGVPAAYGFDHGSIDPGSRHEFRDDAWVGGEPLGTDTLWRPLWSGMPDCAERLRSCVVEFRRVDLLTSTAADGSANRTVDITGHALGVNQVVTIERVSVSGFLADFGIAATWEVGGEETLDAVGWHAWEILEPDASPNGRWLPIRSYRFAESSPGRDSPTGVPEASTWTMLGVGFATLGCGSLLRRYL